MNLYRPAFTEYVLWEVSPDTDGTKYYIDHYGTFSNCFVVFSVYYILRLRLVAHVNRPVFMLDGLNTRRLMRLDELTVSKHKNGLY